MPVSVYFLSWDFLKKGVCSIQKPDLFLNAFNKPVMAQMIPDLVRCGGI
jgi:hypothetical protein